MTCKSKQERAIRVVYEVLDWLIAILGLAAGACRYIAYADWQFLCWMIVLACACLRSVMWRRQLDRTRDCMAVAEMQLQALVQKVKGMVEDEGK